MVQKFNIFGTDFIIFGTVFKLVQNSLFLVEISLFLVHKLIIFGTKPFGTDFIILVQNSLFWYSIHYFWYKIHYFWYSGTIGTDFNIFGTWYNYHLFLSPYYFLWYLSFSGQLSFFIYNDYKAFYDSWKEKLIFWATI